MTTETAVTVIENEAQQPAVIGESAALLSVIERAARDPNVDIDKMERLMAMHERMVSRNAASEFNSALASMQPELPIITQHGAIVHNGRKISSYAKWDDIVEQVRPVLAKHGFSLTFKVEQVPDKVSVTSILRHSAGHNEATTLTLPIDTSGAKNAVQGIGSTVSYAKRYSACALLNIASTDEDNDGQGGDVGFITAAQKQMLVDLMKETSADTEKFLKYMGVSALDEIKAADFTRAKTGLEAKKGRN